MSVTVLHGDMLERLAELPDASLHSCVCDPPYGLAFMGKRWDHSVPGVDYWQAVYRVVKPGAHLVAFGGTRTYHRMVCAIEDAGFEIRDQLEWLYSSGFPKGLNVVNQLVKKALCRSYEHAHLVAQTSPPSRVGLSEGKERIAVALARILPGDCPALITEIGGAVSIHVPTVTWPSEWEKHIGLSTPSSWKESSGDLCDEVSKSITSTWSEAITDQKTWNWLIGLLTLETTTPASVTIQNGLKWPAVNAGQSSAEERKNYHIIPIVTALGDATWNPVAKFNGFNVALKPAHEPICLARKPLSGTVAANVLEHGTGALNVDGCRVGFAGDGDRAAAAAGYDETRARGKGRPSQSIGKESRDGTNTYDPHAISGRWPPNLLHDGSPEVMAAFARFGEAPGAIRSVGPQFKAKSGTAAYGDYGPRPDMQPRGDTGTAARFFPSLGFGDDDLRFWYGSKADADDRLKSRHPTVKPVALMRWLVRLVTPPNGTVLDPFAGTGTTGAAAIREGFHAVLVEREAEYVADIKARLAHIEGADTPLFAGAAE